MKKTVISASLALLLGLGLSSLASAAPLPGEEAGFEEFPVGDDIEVGPLNVGAVYFQPVDMEPAGMGLAADEADFHLEADISALENTLGYGKGEFVPYLKVDFEIIHKDGPNKGEIATSGTFMAMNATDGPHYGANVKLPGAGTYDVRFIIHNPEANGFFLHTDAVTGVEGRFWNEPLVAEWTDFDYIPRQW